MLLKYLPKDADIGELAYLSMAMTQSAVLRIYEIVELEKRPLKDTEILVLENMIDFFNNARNDVRKFKKRSAK
jgi:hypothetical protein